MRGLGHRPERGSHSETARAHRVVDSARPLTQPSPRKRERERLPPLTTSRNLLWGALERGEQSARRRVGVGGVGAQRVLIGLRRRGEREGADGARRALKRMREHDALLDVPRRLVLRRRREQPGRESLRLSLEQAQQFYLQRRVAERLP